MRCVSIPLALSYILLAAALAEAGETVFSYDFEAGADLGKYPGLAIGETEAAIVPGGADGTGHALRFHNVKPGRYASVTIKQPFPVQKNLVLSFDHREEIEADKEAAYLGILFFDPEGKQWFGSDKFGPAWKHAEIELGKMNSSNQGVMTLGHVLERVNLYGRAKGDTQAIMTVWLDNVTLSVKTREGRLTDEERVSTANPPLFNWPRGEGEMKLEYWASPTGQTGQTGRTGRTGQTTIVTVPHNFHTPPAPLTPGLWHWRVWTSTPLTEGWSDTFRLRIVPEAHRFTTEPVPTAKIAASPHPRVIDLAAARRDTAGKTAEALVKQAESIHRTGVPPDPPRYAPGNPEWPTWIDWYGKVHGGITARTGRRLQTIAQLCALTRDPQVIAWTKEMAFAAAAWDPNGGSAMNAGDIGAHHLLRGLNWCYDALHGDLTADERAKLRAVIVTRAEQFAKRLNPFRGGEANNHAWLQAFGLAEAGFVLMGEHDQAAEWPEYVRQLYLGKFLCCLGYQGDNNEGIGYWGYGLSFIVDYADMMKHVCGIDLFRHPWLYQTARFPMYSAPPGAWAVSFADTGKPNHGVKGPAVQSQVRDLALRTRDPYALWYSGAAGPVDGLAPKPPVDLPQSIHYRHIGWVIFNTSLVDGREGATFAMRSGPFYAGHQHDDQNGFVIHAYGEKLAIDSGYYDWYGSEHFKKYSSLTRAHNTLLVNGQDQAHMKPGADGRIAAYFDSPAYGYTVGDASDPDVYLGQLKRFDRRVLFIKPGFVVIHDVLESSGEPARYDWLLHTVAPIETDAARQTFSLASGAAALRGRFLAPALSMAVVKGYPVEPVDGYSTRPVPPEKYAHEWTLTATPAKTAVQEDFLTALQIRRLTPAADPEARIEPLSATNALGVRITQGDDVHLVLFRKRDSSGPMECETLASDGQVAAVRLVRQGPKASLKSAFAVGATFVRDPGGPIVSSTVPADWALLVMRDGKLATVNVGKAASVLLSAAAMPRAVLVDGKSVPVRFAPKAPFISINLSEGEHTIAYGEYPEAVTSRPMPKLTIRTERVQGELDGYEQRQPDDCLRYWWGAVAVGKTDRYRLILEGWQHVAPPNVTCDGKPANVKAEGGELAGGLWLTEGSHFLGLSGRGNLAGIRFLHEDRPMSRAEMLPKSFTPAKGSILIEAENAAVEGEVKGKVMEKVAASGGVAHCVWDTLGQWAEWDVGVEREGRYELLVRGASEHDEILRELRLDGRAPQLVRFAATGGWCRTADDWRYFRVLGADGQPVRFHLAAGKHRLRLEHFGGSMNIDLLAWQPVE